MATQKHQNSILASLPEDELRRLEPHLSLVELTRGVTLVRPNRKLEYAYFLETGLASIVITMRNGTQVEAGVVGFEGMTGISILLGSDSTPYRTFMQMPGSAFRLKAAVLRDELEKPGKLRWKLQRYLQAHLMQVSQTAACNCLHEVVDRMARWFLMCQDRTVSGDFQITHESLAEMLGTLRPTVTLAAGILQRAGLIEYSRGRVKILNRKGLEKASCECYQTVRQEYKRLEVR